MQNCSIIKQLSLLLLFAMSTQAFSQLSKTHYIPPLTSSSFGNANPEDQYIYLSTPSISNIPFTVKPVGQPTSSYITGTVSNTNTQQISVGTGNGQLFIPSTQSSIVTNNRGYIIEAEAPIYVSVRMNAGSGAQAGALVSKGATALGRTFRVGTFTNGSPQDNYLSFVSVMATQDNTLVNFSDLPPGLVIKNYSGPKPVDVVLNKGESYTIAANSLDNLTANLMDGLIGCLITSDKDIVVNCGSANGSFGTGGGRDYGIDQIVELSKVGTEYIFVRGDGSNDWENVLVVAHSDNTTISINGNTAIASINAGQYYVIEGNSFNSNGNMYVETSQPVFAYQGVGGLGNSGTASEANQGMFFVPPLSCETRGNLDNIAQIENIGTTNYQGGITIVTKVGASISINSSTTGTINTGVANTVTGKPDYVTYKIKGITGNISVQSNDELYCAYFNYNGAATSGSFYSGFPSAPEINFDAQFVTLGNCIPNITLSAANTQNFDSFEWWFDDGTGSGFQNTLISTPDITPMLPGKYKLIGMIACSGLTLESVEVPVSICPKDIDNDGIIDNIDIDNDNDGILNCTESKGDVILNLQNTNVPQLVFQDGSTNSLITTGSYTQSSSSGGTNTFLGNNISDFTSTVAPANDAFNDYSLSFTESVNLKFMENISVTHNITDGEFFIAKIFPVNKNITLLDPDNRLLVDSNYDGIFETGVFILSGSEIHFKINPSATGSSPYVFFANEVDGFSFIHKLNNITTASTFQGNLSLTCFKLDTDLDAIQDALDLDSDNDGIPDFIENIGTLITLSGIDADLNGLDDVYNINSIPLDSDNDSVYDFYDLDSDNDGIYDLEESGSGLPDTVFNGGVIDNVLTTMGVNGWDDNAETSPDSNLIGYTLNDLDADSIFSYIDLDSDGDLCSDVIEAGFSDANSDNLLGDTVVIAGPSGRVTNASDGYTIPNVNYLIFAPISISSQPIDTEVCELSNTTIALVSSAIDTIKWEISTDGVNWNALTDNIFYSGSQTASLTISNTPLSYNAFQYRAFLNLVGNSCGLYTDEIELTVHPLPIVSTPVTLVQCDDDDTTTLGYSPFNLTEANDKISANASNELFTYFLSQTAASSGAITSLDYISNPTTFINRTINTDMVWARIENSMGCASISEIQLFVSSTAIPSTFLVTFNQCDDFLDINGTNNATNDKRDGISTFDFSSVNAAILSFIPSGQNPLPPRYYRSEADALAERDEITDTSNYRNIGYPNSQFIYVRVDSNISNDCLGLGAHILLNVEPLPIANTVTIARQCDYDTSDTAITYPFDTSQIENALLGSQNPANVTIIYFDGLGTSLPSPLPNPFLTASQLVTVRITNNTTSAPDGPCYDESTLDFAVDAQPIANPISTKIVCDGDIGDNGEDGVFPFDTSTYTNTILGAQTGMEIYFDYFDANGISVVKSTSLPNPLISGNQTINVAVINPLNINCTASTSINLVVNPLPNFTVDSPQIVCTTDPNFTVELDPSEISIAEPFTYEWYFDGTFLSNAATLTVSTPGKYSITLTKTDGTRCSRTREIIVEASEKATITQNDVTIVDLSENNSVTINTTHLGRGNYQFGLREVGSPFINYQVKPFFNNVKPGFYTIYVEDAICGVATLDVSVIGHAKYFTPNGDGFNDYWQIKGVNSIYQPNSTILIYDRYGKLVKQLSVQSNGWDGTFNGALLPADDYWFKVFLEDSRQYSGHFTLKR
jgi:gliding motility-associated-like protein